MNRTWRAFPRNLSPLFARLCAWTFALGLVASACTPRPKGPGPSQSPAAQQQAQLAHLKLPPPLPLPKVLPAKLYLAKPSSIEAKARIALEDPRWSLRGELQEALAVFLDRNDAQRIASVWDLERPLHYLALGRGVEIMAASIDPQRKQAVENWMNSLPKAGDFGARQLPAARPARAPSNRGKPARSGQAWVIWTGPNQQALYIAPSLRGLVTAINLRPDSQEIKAFARPSLLGRARQAQLALPREIKNIRVEGKLQALAVDLDVDPAFTRPLQQFALRAPPIPTLLRDPSLVWAGTSTWQGHSSAVGGQLSRVRRLVEDLPFLIRPTAQDLEARLGKTLRQWDGRSFVGFDAQQSLRLGLGVKSLPASEKATLGLIQAAIPNLALMRNFSNEVPSARLLQQRARSHDQKIHELILSDISAHLPADLHSLLSRRRQLHIAMSWSTSANALMLAVGPQAVPSMLSWIEASKAGAPFLENSPRNPTLQARSTLAAMMVLHWLENPQALPSLAQLLRTRQSNPRQDYSVSMSQQSPSKLHFDLKIAD